jgi:hypothetical protein
MTLESLESTLNDWTEILWCVVPPMHLNECFVIAYRDKPEGSFFDPSAICRVWNRMKAFGVSTEVLQQRCSLCAAFKEDVTAGACPFHPVANSQEILSYGPEPGETYRERKMVTI